jgi:3-phosphoshikimate 1-carboxyvinyltransferase
MERIRKPLAEMGADVALTEGHAPVTIRGRALKAVDYTTPVPSAQVKTCILLAGLQTEGMTTVREAIRTRDHSELALRAFGAKLTRRADSVRSKGRRRCMRLMRRFRETFLRRRSFFARRRCFRGRTWCWLRWG